MSEVEEGWVRLDPRKLLIDPVKAVRSFIVPAVIALIGVSNSGFGFRPWLVPVVILAPLVFGALPWLTTYYRLGETQLQVRTGLLNKKSSTAPLDRIRSVDLEASVIHRLLGVVRVKVGTGVDDDRIELDALAVADAGRLREELLARRTTPASAPDPSDLEAPVADAAPEADPAAGSEQVLARIDWSWLRFAPFSLARLVIVAGALGVLSQFVDDLPIFDAEHLTSFWRWVTSFAVPLVVGTLAVGALVAWLLISLGGYVLQWWGLRLARAGGNLTLRSGLLTTRSISVEEDRVRGVRLTETWLLRRVGGAELATMATGVDDGVTTILPPSPVGIDRAVAGDVLGDTSPITVVLAAHGRAARRRSHLRVQRVMLVLAALTVVPVVLLDLPWWLPLVVLGALCSIGAYVGETAYRHLGHALTARHLVAGDARVARVRTVLERDGVIGWVLHETWWQRRAGLVDLTATTAAGSERVLLRDVSRPLAIELASSVTPDAVRRWVTPA